ncbi:MAG: PQQ-binding-like beta-propeller repeat protein [Parvibaculales bacterium]
MNIKGLSFSSLPIFLIAIIVNACGGAPNQEKLAGERIAVLEFEEGIKVDPELADLEVALPVAYRNSEWKQPGGNSVNAPGHLELKGFTPLFKEKVAIATTEERRIFAPPIIANGLIFIMGANLDVHAFDAKTRKKKWIRDFVPRNGVLKEGFGGGLAYGEENLFVTTGFGNLTALNPKTGETIWEVKSDIIFRAPPLIEGGRVYVLSNDNQLQVYSEKDGGFLWSHTGIIEPATILGAPSPAVLGEVVIVGYSSGEIYNLLAINGTQNWTDTLLRKGKVTPISSVNSITARPVIDGNLIITTSHGGRMAAMDVLRGERLWTQDIASLQTPAVSGYFIFVVTIDAKLICIIRNTGRVKWVEQLPQFKDVVRQEKPIEWNGPVLAGEKLILTSTEGDVATFSPQTGKLMEDHYISEPITLPPVIADGVLYILSDHGTLFAFQ